MSPRFSIRPLTALGDRRLAELAAEGDERAFEVLVRRHRGELERYCRRLGLSEHRAEDVMQQSFTRAWLALSRGSAVGQPRAWLYRIVHNAALNAHRNARLRAHEPIESVPQASLAVAAGGHDVEAGMLARDALRQVAALPQMQREAVVMTAIEGRSHEEAAGIMGVSDGAVRGLVHRARTKLRMAAAALSPHGLVGLLAKLSAGGADAEQPVGAAAGAAGAGLAGVLGKGVAVTAVTGLLAGGAVVRLERGHSGREHHSAPAARAEARGAGAASATPLGAAGEAQTLRPAAERRGSSRSAPSSRGSAQGANGRSGHGGEHGARQGASGPDPQEAAGERGEGRPSRHRDRSELGEHATTTGPAPEAGRDSGGGRDGSGGGTHLDGQGPGPAPEGDGPGGASGGSSGHESSESPTGREPEVEPASASTAPARASRGPAQAERSPE